MPTKHGNRHCPQVLLDNDEYQSLGECAKERGARTNALAGVSAATHRLLHLHHHPGGCSPAAAALEHGHSCRSACRSLVGLQGQRFGAKGLWLSVVSAEHGELGGNPKASRCHPVRPTPRAAAVGLKPLHRGKRPDRSR